MTNRELLGIVFCPTCNCDTLPHEDGWCFFCDTQIVPKKPKAPKPKGKTGRKILHTPEVVIAEIQHHARELGHPPPAKLDLALTSAARRRFGSWGKALAAAGFKNPGRGLTYTRWT